MANQAVRSLCLVIFIISTAQTQEEMRPPNIGSTNPAVITYLSNDVELKCEADGIPEPRYQWYRNGKIIQIGGKYSGSGSKGNIVVSVTEGDVSGQYHCEASNAHGKAITLKVTLQKAVLLSWTGNQEDSVRVTVNESSSVKFACNGLPSTVPAPSNIKWTKRNPNTAENNFYSNNGRISWDSQGYLHFAFVSMEDSYKNDGFYYMCYFTHRIYGIDSYGSKTQLIVNEVRKNPDKIPHRVEWVSGIKDGVKGPVVGLRGKSIKLKCLFSGKPNPEYTWTRIGSSLPIGRWEKTDQTDLEMKDLAFKDEGIYQCQSQQGVTADINVTIEAAPFFRTPYADLTITEGDDAVVKCDVAGKPKVKIEYMINGTPLKDLPPSPRRIYKMDANELHFKSLNRSTDLQVVQCKSSNKHGVLLANAFLNVIRRTVIIQKPVGATLDGKLDSFNHTFVCAATSDPSTPMTFAWYRNEQLLFNDSNKVLITRRGSNSTLYVRRSPDDRDTIEGNYSCLVRNGHSQQRAFAELSLIDTIEPEESKSVEKSIWWVWVVVGICVALLAILLVICLVRRNTGGETYKVDEKERRAGHDPIKELKQSSFMDYIRPNTEPVAGSRASLTDSIKPPGSESDSLAEYGEAEPGHFNENGSFIGQYGNADSREPLVNTSHGSNV